MAFQELADVSVELNKVLADFDARLTALEESKDPVEKSADTATDTAAA